MEPDFVQPTFSMLSIITFLTSRISPLMRFITSARGSLLKNFIRSCSMTLKSVLNSYATACPADWRPEVSQHADETFSEACNDLPGGLHLPASLPCAVLNRSFTSSRKENGTRRPSPCRCSDLLEAENLCRQPGRQGHAAEQAAPHRPYT